MAAFAALALWSVWLPFALLMAAIVAC